MHWLLFKIAKKIGTLYLIFAAFAGMIGIAYTVVDIFTYIFSDNIFTAVHITSNIVSNEVGVQTEELVNTVSGLDSISETPQLETPVVVPHQQPIHVDEGVQTSNKSLFSMFNEWAMELFGLDSSGVGTPHNSRVEEWLDNLDSSQSISSVDEISEGFDSNNQPLVEVSDLIYEEPVDVDEISEGSGLDSSEVGIPQDSRVEEWLDSLDSSQSIPSVDEISEESDSNNQPLVEVSDLIFDITD